MHMVSKKDLNKAELETMRTSRSPTTVMTANGEVPAKEEATVHVKELELFVTVMLLEGIQAVLSLAKLCEDHVVYLPLDQRSKNHISSQKGKRIDCNTSDYAPFVVPGLSTSSSTIPTHTSSTSSSQDSEFDVGRYTETRCINQLKPKKQIQMKDAKDAKKYRAIHCMTCWTASGVQRKFG